jgi:hypothetical protein
MSDSHNPLQGWNPELSSPEEVRASLDQAFDYRGDVTLTLKSGERVDGYVFDRRCEGPRLEECFVRLFPKDREGKISVSYADIAGIEFSGRDMASGRSYELWMQKYREKKSRGEKDVRLEPETLD